MSECHCRTAQVATAMEQPRAQEMGFKDFILLNFSPSPPETDHL